jgi:hypothetical protein
METETPELVRLSATAPRRVRQWVGTKEKDLILLRRLTFWPGPTDPQRGLTRGRPVALISRLADGPDREADIRWIDLSFVLPIEHPSNPC